MGVRSEEVKVKKEKEKEKESERAGFVQIVSHLGSLVDKESVREVRRVEVEE